jgi:hypothetical protein
MWSWIVVNVSRLMRVPTHLSNPSEFQLIVLRICPSTAANGRQIDGNARIRMRCRQRQTFDCVLDFFDSSRR